MPKEAFESLLAQARAGRQVDLTNPSLEVWQSAVLRVEMRTKKK